MRRISQIFFSVPTFFLSFGLLVGIFIGIQIQVFNFALNFSLSLILILALLLTNQHSRILSAIIAIFVGIIVQNSWQYSMDLAQSHFFDGDKIELVVDFYSPPTFQNERRMTQLATIAGRDFRINLIFTQELTAQVLIPGEQATILGIFRRLDTQNTAPPWEFDNVFQSKIRNTIGELEIISINKKERNATLSNIYRHIRQNFEQSQFNSFYISLFTGDRSFLTQYIRSFFRESGLVHFLAISGLHIAILIVALSTIIWILPLPKLWRRCLVVIAILFLPFLVGFGPATIRAVIMGVLLSVSPIFNRKNNSMNSLFLTAFLILMVYPMHVFLIGFQYSFVATFAILLLIKMIGQRKFKNEIMFLAMPIFLFAVTTPIQIWHFGTITPISVVSNIIMLPVLTLICQVALISVFLSAFGFLQALSSFIVSVCDNVLSQVLFSINRLVLLSGFGEEYTQISPFVFIAISLIIIFFALYTKKRAVLLSIYLILAFSTIFLLNRASRPNAIYTISSQNLRMLVFDGSAPQAVILGGRQYQLFYNPQFLRWLHSKMQRGRKTPTIITDSPNFLPNLRGEFNYIVISNATGEILFEGEAKTTAIEPIERRNRRANTPRVFERRVLR